MSETSKPTPGPWEVRPHTHGGVLLIRPGCIQDSLQIVPDADARLIAASPELLEQLKIARTLLRKLHYAGPEREAIDAAIAKAEGR